MEYSIFLNEIEKVWDVRPSIYEHVLFTFIAFLGGSDVIETLGGYTCHVLKIVLTHASKHEYISARPILYVYSIC